MKIVNKKIADIKGTITTDTNGNIIITLPPTDSNGYLVTRIDVSGLKDVTTATGIVYIEDRSDDGAKIQELTSEALTLKQRLEDTTNPPSDLEKAVIMNRFAEIDKEIKPLSGMSIYELI